MVAQGVEPEWGLEGSAHPPTAVACTHWRMKLEIEYKVLYWKFGVADLLVI